MCITNQSPIFAYKIMKYITVLTIAGSDCSGGAGIQADIKTISALGCYAASAITAVTVQDTCGVKDVLPVPAKWVGEQIKAAMEDLMPDAVKIGMVTDKGVISAVAASLNGHGIPVIFDPVLISSSGYPLVSPEAMDILVKELIPICTLLTPNIPEAETLSGGTIRTSEDMAAAGRVILMNGCRAVLVKGGHLRGHDMTDVLVTGGHPQEVVHFHATKIDSRNTHGTGCTLSSAIASYLARGENMPNAVAKGKQFLSDALAAGKDVSIGKGHGPLNHFFAPEKLIIK